MTYQEEPKSYLFEAQVSTKLPMAVSGSGNRIIIADPKTGTKKSYIDGSTGAAVGSLDHHDPEILEAIRKASEECVYSFPSTICNYPAEELAKFIITHSAPGAFASATFVGSGSEANENALKIIRQYFVEKGEPERTKFISRNQSYHGYTLGALSIGKTYRWDDFKAVMMPEKQTPKVSECNPYHNLKKGETLEQYKDRLLDEIEKTFIAAGPNKVCAFICETVSGSSLGCQPPVPGYLEGIRKICDKYGALMMLDEVMCGLGRCGSYNTWEQFLPKGMSPDIQTIGKTLGSGYVTIAGVLVSPKIKNVVVNGSGHIIGSQTFHCHSFNCSVALAVQQKIFKNKLIENSKNVGQYLSDELEKAIGSHKYVGIVKGDGLFRGVEFVQNKETKMPFDPSIHFGKRMYQKCFENGLTVMSNDGCYKDNLGDIIVICPSYTIDKETADEIVKIVSKSLDEVTEDVESLL